MEGVKIALSSPLSDNQDVKEFAYLCMITRRLDMLAGSTTSTSLFCFLSNLFSVLFAHCRRGAIGQGTRPAVNGSNSGGKRQAAGPTAFAAALETEGQGGNAPGRECGVAISSAQEARSLGRTDNIGRTCRRYLCARVGFGKRRAGRSNYGILIQSYLYSYILLFLGTGSASLPIAPDSDG